MFCLSSGSSKTTKILTTSANGSCCLHAVSTRTVVRLASSVGEERAQGGAKRRAGQASAGASGALRKALSRFHARLPRPSRQAGSSSMAARRSIPSTTSSSGYSPARSTRPLRSTRSWRRSICRSRSNSLRPVFPKTPEFPEFLLVFLPAPGAGEGCRTAP